MGNRKQKGGWEWSSWLSWTTSAPSWWSSLLTYTQTSAVPNDNISKSSTSSASVSNPSVSNTTGESAKNTTETGGGKKHKKSVKKSKGKKHQKSAKR